MSNHFSMDFHIVPNFWLLWTKLLCTFVHKSLHVFISFGLYSKYMFNFESSKLFPKAAVAFLFPITTYGNYSCFTFLSTLSSVNLFNFTNLVGGIFFKWVVLNYVFSLTNDLEHLFMYLLAMSSFLKYLFKFFPIYWGFSYCFFLIYLFMAGSLLLCVGFL